LRRSLVCGPLISLLSSLEVRYNLLDSLRFSFKRLGSTRGEGGWGTSVSASTAVETPRHRERDPTPEGGWTRRGRGSRTHPAPRGRGWKLCLCPGRSTKNLLWRKGAGRPRPSPRSSCPWGGRLRHLGLGGDRRMPMGRPPQPLSRGPGRPPSRPMVLPQVRLKEGGVMKVCVRLWKLMRSLLCNVHG